MVSKKKPAGLNLQTGWFYVVCVCYSTKVVHPNGSSISPFWMLTI